MTNPFIEKAEAKRARCRAIAEGHFNDLLALLRRFTDADNPETRERVRKRVEAAREAVDHYA